MLSVKGISFTRGAFTLRTGNLSVTKGEKIAIIGENGSGKSTLLHILTGLIDCGGIEYGGVPLESMNALKRASLLAFMPQLPSVVFPFTVFEVVRLGRYAGRHMRNADAETDETLRLTGLDEMRERPFNELSGGEKRRVMLARALNQGTDTLFLDEPVSMLDVRHSLEITELLIKSDKTVIASMHDVNLSMRYFDRVWMMTEGNLLYDIAPEQATTNMLSEVFNVTTHFSNNHYSFSI
jgi:iron complex transport system ATP-binding protein